MLYVRRTQCLEWRVHLWLQMTEHLMKEAWLWQRKDKNSWHLLSTLYAMSIFLSVFFCFILLVLIITEICLLSHVYRWENWGQEVVYTMSTEPKHLHTIRSTQVDSQWLVNWVIKLFQGNWSASLWFSYVVTRWLLHL